MVAQFRGISCSNLYQVIPVFETLFYVFQTTPLRRQEHCVQLLVQFSLDPLQEETCVCLSTRHLLSGDEKLWP